MASPLLTASIVVACRNERKHIRGLVEAILAQRADRITLEAIVADGLSDDGTREILDQYASRFPQIRVVTNSGRFVSHGLNTAIREARGEYIIRMDAHTEYAEDYVECCLRTLIATGADNAGGPARTKASGFVGRAVAAAYHSRFSTGGAKFHNQSYEGPADTVPYGCWRRDTLITLGLFDETLVRNQDDELNLRIIRSGGTVWQSPQIRSWYHPRSTVASLWKQYFQYGFWKVRVIRKHRIPASWRHLAPGLFVIGNAVSAAAAVAMLAAGRTAEGTLLLQLWSAVVLGYATVCIAISAATANRTHWKLFPILPIVFATYHLSYGSGFILGLLQYRRSATAGVRANAAYSGLSR